MQTVVSSSEMRHCDETTIATYRVPGLVLMDRAGTSAAHVILRREGSVAGRRIAVVCGKGNNGGDGCVVARVLAHQGASVRVILTSPASAFRGDAAQHFAMVRKLAQQSPDLLNISSFSAVKRDPAYRPDLIVDAVMGTGFAGAARGTVRTAIEWMNRSNAPIVALDIPSGVDGTLGTAAGPAVRAQATITFGLLKSGLLLNEGRTLSGHVTVVDIGIPRRVTSAPALKTFLMDRRDVSVLLPKRPHRLHKYTAGKVLVIAGARGFTGAAALTTLAALRSGAGAVVLATPDVVLPILAKKLTEPVLMGLPTTSEGTLDARALDVLRDRFAWADTVLVGPGLGRSRGVHEFISGLLSQCSAPLVLDADALFVLASIAVRKGKKDWIVTPHAGEFSTMSRMKADEADRDRISSARTYAKQSGLTVVFKGSPTCVGASDGTVYINPTGNPGMATMGSGDVLAGIIAGLRAQGMTSVQSAYAGAYIHGAAGDAARDQYGERSLLAGDILLQVPAIMKGLEQRA